MMAKIPKSPRSNCYFGCNAEGPLHHFPKPEKDVERFEIWKAVLENDTTEKGNMYIFNQLRLCNKHFENYYILPSNRLTRNAIPTLYIKKDDMSICASTSTEKSIETGTAVLIDKATKKSIKQKFLSECKILPVECEDTADLLLVFDKLYDSFNGHSYHDTAKVLKGSLKNNSKHFQFWDEIMPILKSISFEKVVKNRDAQKQ